MATSAGAAAPEVKQEELVPTLNGYVRSKLGKSEIMNFADCARALASAASGSAEPRDALSKALPRLALFGVLPPSILPILLNVRAVLDNPKQRGGADRADRKLLRLLHYYIQLSAGDGSAGSPVPFSPLVGGAPPVRATDQFDYDVLAGVYGDAKAATATALQRASAFRQLAALSRASLTSNADDAALLGELLSAVATCLDRVEASRRRKAPGFLGQNKKTLEADRRAALERLAAQRCALSAARVGLPRAVLSTKIAPRAYSGINSNDALCARHALAVASLVALEAPHTYAATLGQLLRANVEVFRATGSLAASAEEGMTAAPQVVGGGGPIPIRPSKDLFQERSLNLTDPWSRVYLARGCGAVLRSGYAGGSVSGAAAPFWAALTIMACCDRSTIVAMEAVKALAGAPLPAAAALRPAGGRRPPALDEGAEAETAYSCAAAWQMLISHAHDATPGKEPPAPDPLASAAARFTVNRNQRGLQPNASLRRLASGVAGGGAGGGQQQQSSQQHASAAASKPALFASIVRRVCASLGQMSHAAACCAARAVAALAEARARALAAARSPEERALLLGDEDVQALMAALEERMFNMASDPGFSAHQRELALEALLWLQPLPLATAAGEAPSLVAADLVEWTSSGGGTTSATVRAIFADPWSEDAITNLLFALGRRMASCPAAAEYLLGLAAAPLTVCPSRVRPELLHQMWDTCLKSEIPGVKMSALRTAMALLRAPPPPIAQPPSAAAPEVKALASKEEAGAVALQRAAAWWLAENANFGAGEFAWRPRALSPALLDALDALDGLPGQDALAAAAAAANPILSVIIAHLQRAMAAGPWEVRIAAAQGLAKVAVRAGEPFRVQCYALLAAAVPERRGLDGGGAGAGGVGSAAGGAGGGAADPLGVAASVGPALEVLDHMYAGELVVDELLSRYGPKRKRWPKAALEMLALRCEGLTAAINERVAFVPKDVFCPLGPRAAALLAAKDEDADKEEKDKQAGEEGAAAAEGEEVGEGDSAAAAARYADSSADEDEDLRLRSKSIAAKLEGFEFDPDRLYDSDATGFGSGRGSDDDGGAGAGGGSDDDSDVVVQHGVVLFDFAAEEEDEAAVAAGERVEVLYEVGGWYQVQTVAGVRGLVPGSYVQLDDDAATSASGGAGDGGGDSSSVASESAASAAEKYNSFLERSNTVRRDGLRRRSSIASSYNGRSGLRRLSSDAGGGRRGGGEEEYELIDPMVLSGMMSKLHDASGALEGTLTQVESLDAATRGGGMFNMPQYLHLKELLSTHLSDIAAIGVAGEARGVRRQVRGRALGALDTLEALKRFALGGDVGGGSFSGGGGGGASLRRRDSSGYGGDAYGRADDGAAATSYTRARAAYAFEGEAEGELTVSEGEALWVEAEIDGWYSIVRESDGERGLVPASYVELLE